MSSQTQEPAGKGVAQLRESDVRNLAVRHPVIFVFVAWLLATYIVAAAAVIVLTRGRLARRPVGEMTTAAHRTRSIKGGMTP